MSNLSYRLGKNHVVGVSGEAGRKIYLEHKDMDHIKGVVLIGHGPDYIDGRKTPQHGIWKPYLAGGKSWAQRRLLELLKTAQLAKRLPDCTRDAREAFEAVAKSGGIINPARYCYEIVCVQATRIVATDELVDNPKLRAKLMHYLPILQHTSSCHLLSFPYLSYFSLSYWKRIYGREGLRSIIAPLVTKRMEYGADRKDDALQHFVDQGDSHDYITQFMVSMTFISGANGCVLAGAMLYSIAHHPEIQERCYQEIKAAANARCKDKTAPLVEQLNSLSVDGWENMSSMIDMCYKECIRMWVAFPMGRMNEGKEDIVIPGTNEIIPAGGLASYNTIDVHFNEKLYPEPMKWDPARFGPGRKEMEQEAHGCKSSFP